MTRRIRSPEPQSCDCPRAQHVHGTFPMYQTHKCGCAPCTSANADNRRKYRHRTAPPKAAKPAAIPEPAPTTTEDLFVATFPYYGGYSVPHLRRVLRYEVFALAEAQGVELLPGDPQIRIDRTGAGVFAVVLHRAESSRPVAEVRERAAVLAYEHEQAHPALARWINKHLQEVA